MKLTPRMRADIAQTVIEAFDGWAEVGMSWDWEYTEDEDGHRHGGFVWAGQHPVETMGDFFDELTGQRDFFDRWHLRSYGDDFMEWLKEYLGAHWGDAGYEEDDEGNDAMLEAERRVLEWLDAKKIHELRAEYRALIGEDSSSGSWLNLGF